MTRAAALPVSLLLLFAAALLASPVAAQDKTYSGVCEEIFVPDYPKAGNPGMAFEDFGLMGLPLFEKAIADCDKRVKGFFASDKIKMAHLRIRAINGDRTALPRLREIADSGHAEASFLIQVVHAESDPVPPHKPEAKDLTRAEAERELRRAAEKDHVLATYYLARGLTDGTLMRRDLAEARVWVEKLLTMAGTKADRRAAASLHLASIYFDDPKATAEERKRIPKLAADVAKWPALAPYAVWLETRGRRLGIGWPQDESAARALAERPGVWDKAPPLKFEFLELLRASGDPQDRVKLVELLETAKPLNSRLFDQAVGEMLFTGIPGGFDRQRSFAFSVTLASQSHEDAVALSRRIVDYGKRVAVPTGMVRRLYEAVDLKLPGADEALVRLKESVNSDAHKGEDATGLAQHFGASSEGMTLYLLEKVANAGPYSIYAPFDARQKAVDELDRLAEKGVPAALRIKGFALRRGKIYAQDDVEATRYLLKAAEAGDAPAMKMVADAYSSGTGIAENREESLRWLRAAAKAGLADAQSGLVNLLPFRFAYSGLNVHDALMDGIIIQAEENAVLGMNLGVGRSLGAQDIERLGVDYVARGHMDGFRASMAARVDEVMVRLMKPVAEEVKLEIATILKQEGFLAAQPDRYMGPAARMALAKWARAKGLPDSDGDKPGPSADEDARLTGVPQVPPETIARLRGKAFADFEAAKTKDAQKSAMQMMSVLAQYGDIESRLAILKGFSDSNMAVQVVAPGLAVVYGIDVLLSNPPGAEKAEFDFVFMVSNMYGQGKLPIAVDAMLYTLRDDPRLWGPEDFDKIADRFIFIPGYCDQLLLQAQKAKVAGLDGDACSPQSRRALVAWAKGVGPIGAEAQIRREAAALLLKLPK
jgi:TPR repeat protein